MNDHTVALEERIKIIEDREAISRLLYQYGKGLDTLNWEILASIYTDDVELLMVGPTGDVSNALIIKGLDRFLKTARHLMTRLLGTQHVSTHHEIEVNGDRAKSSSYMTAFHVIPGSDDDDDYVAAAGGLYKHEFIRTDAGWRITYMQDGTIWQDPRLPQGEALFSLPRVRGEASDDLPVDFFDVLP